MQKKDKNLQVLCILLIPVFWMCNDSVSSVNGNSFRERFENFSQTLESAYNNQSENELKSAFEMWQWALPPYTSNELSAFSDTVQQVYEIFREFYTPTDLERITNGYHENFETEYWYIVIQNSIKYAISETIDENSYLAGELSGKFNIEDFRPSKENLSFPFVYLSTQADSMIREFLYLPDGSLKSDHQERAIFLRQAMQLTHHHWIADYHKATMPIVSYMYMNSTFTKALVHFRVFYQFGGAYLERTEEGWRLVHSELLAIE